MRDRKVTIISVNNTIEPKTGGEYVYSVIKNALIKAGYLVHEISVPIILMRFVKSKERNFYESIMRVMIHMECLLKSLWERCNNHALVITSSSPLFPVMGHLVYHQPKTGMQIKKLKPYMSFYEKIGFSILEKEWLSPFWHFSKKTHIIHLSNSFFTKRLIKEIYGLDSEVLYPPVPIEPLQHIPKRRDLGVIVGKPKVLSGIIFLPKIVTKLPKETPFIVIGEADFVGLRVIRRLGRLGFNIKYLGYVSESIKLKLFKRFSHYLHLGLNETFGVMVIEAMANGCIPIAPKSGGIPEYLPRELLYSSYKEAAEKMASTMRVKDYELVLRLRKIAENFKEEKFESKIISYVHALEQILES